MKCKLPKPAQISPNLRFCFIKRVPRKTLIEVLWLRVILDLNLSNWELYGASWWIIWFSFHFVIYGWSSPWAGRVPQLTRPTAAWTSRPLWSTDRHTASTVLIQGRRKGWKPGGTSRNPRHFEGKGFGKIWVPAPCLPSSSNGPVLCETCGPCLGCLISRIHKTGGKYGSPSRVWTALEMGLI